MVRERADEHKERARCKRKHYYDQSRSVNTVNVGDHVMVKTHPKSDAKKVFSAKLAPRWKGPFVVKELLTPVNLKLQSVDAPRKELIVHVDQLKTVPK